MLSKNVIGCSAHIEYIEMELTPFSQAKSAAWSESSLDFSTLFGLSCDPRWRRLWDCVHVSPVKYLHSSLLFDFNVHF